MKIAIFLPNWVGDAVMATPALRAVRRKFADAEIVAIARPYVFDVLAGLNLVDRLMAHNPRGQNREERGWPFVNRLRREEFDLVLLLPNSLRSAWLAWLSGAKRRIGFRRDGRGLLLTDPVPPKLRNRPHPVLDEYLRLAQQIGCPSLGREMELATTSEDERQFENFRRSQADCWRKNTLVCLNPGGAFGAAKHWPVESFAQLARRMALELGRSILVLCGPAERRQACEIARQADHPLVTSFADTPVRLGLTKAAIRHAELLITTDSGPRHFAPPFDVPVVTLFGPTHIAWSETYYSRSIHLQVDVDCGPCQQRVCPLQHHRCMRELTVGQVFEAAARLLPARAAAENPAA